MIRDNVSTYYLAMNRNKHVVRLDLKNVDDRNRLYEMVKSADVLIENYRPGVARDLALIMVR